MVGYLLGFLLGALTIGYLLIRRGREDVRSTLNAFKDRGKFILSGVAIIILLIILAQSVIIIQAGHVGVVKRLGAVRSEFAPGMHFIVPLIDQVILYPAIKKSYEASDIPGESRSDFPDIIITALTSDGQQIRGSGRRVPTKFAVYDLYTKRSYEAQQVLFDEIAPKFEQNGLILDELVLRNITTEKNKLEQEKIRKEQKIVAAEADAKSIEIRQTALTKNPTIIQWEFVQKLAPNIQWGILPQNMIPMFNLQALSGEKK